MTSLETPSAAEAAVSASTSTATTAPNAETGNSSVVGASEGAPAAPASSTPPTTENGTNDAENSSAKDSMSTDPAPKTKVPVRDKESFDKYQLERTMHRDKIATASLKQRQDNIEVSIKRRRSAALEYRAVQTEFAQFFPPHRLYGEGYNGFGNGHTESAGMPRLIYPREKPRPGRRTTPALPKPSRKEMKAQAEQYEELVPIRVEVDWDKIRLRDTFTWNLHDRLIPIDLFTAQLVEDMGLKAPYDRPVHDQVQHQIRDQLSDFYPHVFADEDALDPELPYSAYKNDEMRILIKLNITIGSVTLVDQFEWEINNPINSPEEFARVMARDLSLSGEFTTAIAHCIREQTQLFTRSLYSVGHSFDGRPVEEPDLVAAFLPSPLPTVFRPQQQAKEYAPYLYELNEADMEKNEGAFLREQRKQKRSVNRRGGPTLPDLKERQRTIRTMVVSSTLPGAAPSIEKSGLLKRVGGAAGGRGRRGAGHGGEFSDSDESEDSAPDSPALSQLPTGTARTRNMRGAATAAQQKMAHLGRSETPEVITSHHHETRVASRRLGGREIQDSPDEPRNRWVHIKIPRGFERVRALLWSMKTGKPLRGSQTPSQTRAPSTAMGPPPTTPSAVRPSLGKALSNVSAASATPQPQQAQLGRLPAPPPPAEGEPPLPVPPPPEWLNSVLDGLRQTYKHDLFEGTMRHWAVHADTEIIINPPPQIPPGSAAPPNVKWMWLPRIRCKDCPGKLYTPGPGESAENFSVHLKNKQHREKVNRRTGKDTAHPTS